jgi:RNA polymerase sigma factor (sigma-70 family)
MITSYANSEPNSLVKEKYPEDRQLVQKVLAGDKEAMAIFLTKKCYSIFNYIRTRRLKSLDIEAKELISDFYIYLSNKDWKVLRTYRFESKLQTWINLVAARYLVQLYKKELQENARENPPVCETTIHGAMNMSNKLSRFELEDAISRLLNEHDRQVLRYTLNDYKTEEIAEKMKVSIANVYVLRNRAIKNLKKLIHEGK